MQYFDQKDNRFCHTFFLSFVEMDAKYLSDNINGALTEALTSMAVSAPDDGVEYVGQYLLQFVERKNMIDRVRNTNDRSST